MLSITRNFFKKSKSTESDYEIGLAGNPNVGKSTIFNALTKMKQHTGNWSGKTVKVAVGNCKIQSDLYKIVDLPGAYSLTSDSKDELVTSEYIEKGNYDCIVFVVDATNLERNLSFVIQSLVYCDKAVLCVNLNDIATKNNIFIDEDELSLQLGIPVVKISAKNKKDINEIKNKIYSVVTKKVKTFKVNSIPKPDSFISYNEYIRNVFEYCKTVSSLCVKNTNAKNTDISDKLDRIFISKYIGIPAMLVLLSILFLITVYGANYISEWMYEGFLLLKKFLQIMAVSIGVSKTLQAFLFDGVYTTVTWIVSVMLPPMAIFFPLFSIMEDAGILPRLAFNSDHFFEKSGVNGKQALTMAMGFGCNACGVTGCRIIESEQERATAIVTNNFIPCNGRLPALIAMISIFIVTTQNTVLDSIYTTVVLLAVLFLCVLSTLLSSRVLRKCIFKGDTSTFVLEIPKLRKPQVFSTILYSLKDRAIFVLLRAIAVAIPAGAIIWLLANIKISDITILAYCTDILEPIGKFIGIDGVILMAFILGFPANETVIPIILMTYLCTGTLSDYDSLSEFQSILLANGWDIKTAICFLIITVFHFPCSTTCITIYKETKSIKLTLLSVALPTLIGVFLCCIINFVFQLF